MTRSLRLACLLVALALPAAGQEAPGPWRVTGVASDDVLNIRAAPEGSAPILGGFAPGAGPVEVTGWTEDRRWARVIVDEGDGWVFARYLAPDRWETVPGSQIPARIRCSGTEPFWDAAPRGSSLVFGTIEARGRAMTLETGITAEGRPWPWTLIGGDVEGQAFLTIRPAACSDGMSDRTYGWAADFLLREGGRTRLYSGCCRVPNPE